MKGLSLVFLVVGVLVLSGGGCQESQKTDRTDKETVRTTPQSPAKETMVTPTPKPQTVAPGEPAVAPATQPQTGSGDIIVYVTRTGAKYHRAGCRSLARSSIPMSLKDAKQRGYTPCSVCKPPQ